MEQWYYYEYAKRASRNIDNHPGLNQLKRLAKTADAVLDFGCGEGTRLETILPSWKKGAGVDISSYAIDKAKKQYPRHAFLVYDGNTLPFPDQTFDLVYSAFVLEHTTNPERAITEMIRVLKEGGHLILLCPNFGAPNRRSPNSIENPLTKLLSGLWHDFHKPQPDSLHWTKVVPKKKYVHIDDDTSVEPYLLTLERFIAGQKLKVEQSSSPWELESFSLNPRKFIITHLGKNKIYPFKYWGPQIFIVAKK